MKQTELTKAMLNMEIGELLQFNKDGEYFSLFIRTIGGWIHVYESPQGPTSCFIPYDDKHIETDSEIKPCYSCDSTDCSVIENIWEGKRWGVSCQSCGAHSGFKASKEEAVHIWNLVNGRK
jgi:hypothetical protein